MNSLWLFLFPILSNGFSPPPPSTHRPNVSQVPLAPPAAAIERNECFVAPAADTLPFGIELGGRDWCRGEVLEGQHLQHVFTDLGVHPTHARAMIALLDTLWDVRNLRAFDSYYALLDPDDQGHAIGFLYDLSSEEYLYCRFGAKPFAWRLRRTVVHRERVVEGTITSSLWQALDSAGADPALAVTLAEMFQWSVDFFHLQKGDNFTLVVKEKFVDGRRRGSGVVHAARFMQQGADHYAFAFEQDGIRRYFDEFGNTLQRTFLAAPLEYTRISSGYSLSRYHPILKIYTPHTGIDYAAPVGTPIFTVADGEILEAQYRGNNGNTIKIRHDDTYMTQYLHLSGFAPGIVPGAKVRQGQVIGYVGSTGLSTGPHLCYRVYKNGVQVNPLEEQLPQGDRIAKVELRQENYLPFLLHREQMVAKMNPDYEPVLAYADKPKEEPIIGFIYW